MAAKRKGAGGNLTRSEVVTVRLDPKLKFAAELAARKQRRTISSFIEWAIEKAVSEEVIKMVYNEGELSALDAMKKVWDVDDADRFVKFAAEFQELLNFEEEQLWKLIRNTPYFFKRVERKHEPNVHLSWSPSSTNIWLQRVRDYWALLNEIVSGEQGSDKLPKIPDNEIIDSPPEPACSKDVPF